MEAQHKDEGRRHGLAASVAILTEEDGSGAATATVSVSTPALVVLGVVGVSACVMLTWGFWLLHDAELALVENGGGGRLAAAA